MYFKLGCNLRYMKHSEEQGRVSQQCQSKRDQTHSQLTYRQTPLTFCEGAVSYSQYFDHLAFILIAKGSSGLPMRFAIPKLQTSSILPVRWYCVLPQTSHCCILHALSICSPCCRSRTHIVCPTPCRSQVLTGLSWSCSRRHLLVLYTF